MSDAGSDKITVKQWLTLLLLLLLSLVIFIALHRQIVMQSKEVSLVAISFLDAYLGSEVGDFSWSEYFVDSDAARLREFDETFRIPSYGYDSYKIEKVSANFVEVRFYLGDTLLAPVIGFWFETNASETKMTDWRVARLQPFSTYDAEFSGVWNDD